MKQRKAGTLTVGVVGWLLCLGISAFLIGGPITVLLPFEPYVLENYQIIPSAACPGAPVTLRFSAHMTPQPLAGIEIGNPAQMGDEALHTVAQWVNLDTGKKLESETFDTDFLGDYGERGGVSSFQRYAPNEPGLWRQNITIFVRGRQALRDVVQVVPTFETDPIRVKAFSLCRN